MEVKYKIRYKGKMVDVSRFDDGSFKVILPNEEKEGEETIHKKIVTYDQKRGWRFESTETKENLTDFEEEQEISELMEIRNQVISQIKFTDDVLALRMEKLLSQLKLLGYSNFNQINNRNADINGYKVLGRVGYELEHFINLGFVHVDSTKEGLKQITINTNGIQTGNISQMIENTQNELAHDEEYMENKDELLETYRKPIIGFKNDAFLSMDKKIKEEDWTIYSKMVRKTAELLLSLNYDILPKEAKRFVPDYSTLQGKELQDKISEIIDSKDFDYACNVEDEFVLTELDDMHRELEGQEDNFVSSSLKRIIKSEQEDRKKYITRYKKYHEDKQEDNMR